MVERIRDQILQPCREHQYLLDSPAVDGITLQKVRALVKEEVSKTELRFAFRWLSQPLHAYHKERIVILIDEYDSPLHVAYDCGYFDDAVFFLRTFFSACLKDNSSLFKGIITGILRVSRESMSTNLIERLALKQGLGLSEKSTLLLNGGAHRSSRASSREA